jgi:hypothetical protein
MTFRRRRIWFPLLLLLAGLVMGTGCNDEDKIVVQNATDDINDPPLIVTHGPEVPNGGFEQITYYSPQGVPVWVLGGDPDGIADLSVAALTVDSISLNHFIARPDTTKNNCIRFTYADTIPSQQILPTPMTLPGIPFLAMTRGEGGLFQSPALGGYLGFPDFVSLSSTLDNWGGCSTSQPIVDGPFYANPPAVPSRTVIVITYVDLEFRGVKVTLYDKVGATAVVHYPDIRIVFTTPEEQVALP